MRYADYADWFITIEPVEVPKPHKVIGVRRRYHDSTIPPLDFRTNNKISLWQQRGSKLPTGLDAYDPVRLDERAEWKHSVEIASRKPQARLTEISALRRQ